MKLSTSGFDTTRTAVIGALPRSWQRPPMTVRERCVAPTYAPKTGAVRPQLAMADLTDHPSFQGNVKGGVRVRTWSPPD